MLDGANEIFKLVLQISFDLVWIRRLQSEWAAVSEV